MKKILVVHTVGFYYGGMSSVIVNYYEHLDKRKYRVDIVANKVVERRFGQLFKVGGSDVYIWNRNSNPIKYFFLLIKLLKKNQYDVIHVHGNSATMTIELLAAYIVGCSVRIAHCHNTACDHVMIHRILNPLHKKLYTKALACSKNAGDWIFGKDAFSVIPNGIEVEKYRFSEEIRRRKRNELNIDDKFVVGHVGFMNEQKNHPKLFEIMAEMKNRYPNVHLLCVTGGNEIPVKLREQMREKEIEEYITVLQKRSDVGDLMQAMDVFVLPSKWEGFGMVALEAQATGLPCVVSDRCVSELNMLGDMRYVSLEASNKEWIDMIMESYNNRLGREKCNDIIVQSDYNILSGVKKLEEIYE